MKEKLKSEVEIYRKHYIGKFTTSKMIKKIGEVFFVFFSLRGRLVYCKICPKMVFGLKMIFGSFGSS